MKISFHPEILAQQKFACNCCGQGCRTFLVSVSQREQQAIEQLQPWREKLPVTRLFVRTRQAKPFAFGLAKHADGRCVFLDDDNLCLIHKLHGLKAKPLACQLYPFVFTPFGSELRVGLRFDCPGICQSRGHSLSGYNNELGQLARQLVPAGIQNVPPPPIGPSQKVSAQRFDAINESLLKIVTSDAMPLVKRLHWLLLFVEHLAKIKWRNVSDDDLPELLAMFRGGLLAEVQRSDRHTRTTTGKPRKLLGHIFFLLSHPPTIIAAQRKRLLRCLRERLKSLATIKQLGRTNGPLPKLQPNWPQCDMADMEKSFGPWPADVEAMLTRYLICRIGGMGYCGPNFYNYSMVEGIRSLLLAMVTIGWLMRIEAIGAGRDNIELSDAHNAVMTIDGNLGYAPALGTGPARLRLRYLTDHLDNFIDCYCT